MGLGVHHNVLALFTFLVKVPNRHSVITLIQERFEMT